MIWLYDILIYLNIYIKYSTLVTLHSYYCQLSNLRLNSWIFDSWNFFQKFNDFHFPPNICIILILRKSIKSAPKNSKTNKCKGQKEKNSDKTQKSQNVKTQDSRQEWSLKSQNSKAKLENETDQSHQTMVLPKELLATSQFSLPLLHSLLSSLQRTPQTAETSNPLPLSTIVPPKALHLRIAHAACLSFCLLYTSPSPRD